MLDTLSTLRKLRRATSDKLTACMAYGGNPTAINNRLEHLRTLGLVDRIREGREWVYFLSPNWRSL